MALNFKNPEDIFNQVTDKISGLFGSQVEIPESQTPKSLRERFNISGKQKISQYERPEIEESFFQRQQRTRENERRLGRPDNRPINKKISDFIKDTAITALTEPEQMIPMNEVVKEWYKPEPNTLRIRDFAREAVKTTGNWSGKAIDEFKEWGEFSWRGFGAFGIALNEMDPNATFTPSTNWEKELFGTDQPISLASLSKEIREPTAEAFGLDPKDERPIFDPAFGLFLATADAFSGGKVSQSIRGASQVISKTDDIIVISKQLRKLGIADDVIAELMPILRPRTKVNQIQKNVFRAMERTAQDSKKFQDPLYARIMANRQAARFGKEVDEVPMPNTSKKLTDLPEELADHATKGKGFGSKERGFITSVRRAFPGAKVGGEYVPRPNDQLAKRANEIIEADINQAESIVFSETTDESVAMASNLMTRYNDLARKAKSQAERNAFYDKVADIAESMAPRLTEQGRSIQAASLVGRLTPEGIIRTATKQINNYNRRVDEALKDGNIFPGKKIKDLTTKEKRDLLEEANDIQKMPDGDEKSTRFMELNDKLLEKIPTPLYKQVATLWKAGLLTGIKTTGLNTMSNLFHGLSEISKDVPSVAVDSVASLFSGKRTIALTGKGTQQGLKEGFEKGRTYFQTGYDPRRNVHGKFDYQKVNFGNSKFAKGLQTYEETIFRWMGTQDQPFYYGAKARSLASQATAQAITKGLKGDEARKFIDDLVANPTDDMLRYATNDAEMAIFANRTILGDAARQIQQIPGGEFVVPFGRTPSAVATQIINYSPIGVVNTIVRNIGKGKFDQRQFSQGIGRGLTGTGVMYIGMKLYNNDMITTNYPKTDRERRQWELEGRKANSIKIGNKWRSAIVLGPLGITAIAGANYQKALNETGSQSDSLQQGTFETMKTFTEQSFLTGLNQFSSALNDPERYGASVLSNTLGSFVPTIISDIARATDPLERRTSGSREGFTAPLRGRVPGLRQATLEPRVDTLGNIVRPLPEDASILAKAGNALETMMDPTRPTRIKSNDVIEELRRLFDAGMAATPTRFADDPSTRKILNNEQRTEMQEAAGTLLEGKLNGLFQHPKYKTMSDEDKMNIIGRFTSKARNTAKAMMIHQIISPIPTQQEKFNKLGEMKGEGFLTQTSFKEWQSLFPQDMRSGASSSDVQSSSGLNTSMSIFQR